MREYGYYKWNHEGLKFESLTDYGDLLTMEEFLSMVEVGGFIDYDGYGMYALEDKQSNKKIRPSDVKKGQLLHGFTHVMWYNR